MTRVEKIENTTLYLGDCLEVMPTLYPVDMVLADPPYGTTACKWDAVIPLEDLWPNLYHIIKPDGAVVLTAIHPFTSVLVTSNLEMFKYAWIWKKSRISHFAQAPYRPLTEHEDILVFSYGGVSKNAKNRMVYNPQGTISCHKIGKGKGHSDHRPSKKVQKNYIQTVTGYPKTIISFQSDGAKLHPTQKPVALMDYLIRTYTNEGDTVLDFAMGSGTTGVACINTGRKFVGIELDEKYFEIACERIRSCSP